MLTITNAFENGVEVKVAEFVMVNGDQVRQHVDELARSTVAETLDTMLDAESEELCSAKMF